MSTRANVSIYSVEWWEKKGVAILYRHCDGYPEWLWEELKEALYNSNWIRDVFELLGKVWWLQFTDCIHWDIEYHYYIEAWFMFHSTDNKWLKLICKKIYWGWKTILLPDEWYIPESKKYRVTYS